MKNKRLLNLFFGYCFFICFPSPVFSAVKAGSGCQPSLFTPGYLKEIDQLNFKPQAFFSNKETEGGRLQSPTPSSLNLNGLEPSGAEDQSPPSQQGSQTKVKNLSETAPAQSLRQKNKEKVKAQLINAFQKGDLHEMKDLITKFPFLKSIRFKTNSYFLQPPVLKILEENFENSFPLGLSLPQLAVLTSHFEMLDMLLELAVDIRSKKKIGTVSVEDNPLHIAIKMNQEEMAKRLLRYEGFVPLKRTGRRRLIDEKDSQKRTPWALAFEKESKEDIIKWIYILGVYKPSAYVEFSTTHGLKDAYQVAQDTQNRHIMDLASRFLVANEYNRYKRVKRDYGHRTYLP